MVQKRSTRQKQALKQASNDFEEFFSAQDLLEKAQQIESSVSRATTYRFLSRQEETSEIFSYHCGSSKVYSTKNRSHCHFICEKSGRVIHFDVDSIKFLQDKIPGTISSFQIEVHGVLEP